jgi:hypothetical protein
MWFSLEQMIGERVSKRMTPHHHGRAIALPRAEPAVELRRSTE